MRPLPINSRAVAVLDWLLRLLPRRLNEATLRPLSDLVLTDPKERQWLATGPDPAFHLVDGLRQVPGSRWYYIEGYLRKHTATLTKLYLDMGAGYSEDHVIALPVTRRGYVREVVRLPDGVRGLRLDPTEASGYLVCEWMSIQAIGRFEALMRRLGRVVYDYHRFSRHEETRQAAQAGLREPLLKGQLQAAYAQSATMRIPSQGNESLTGLWHSYQAQLHAALPRLQAQAQAVVTRPLISVLVPTYNTPPRLLSAMVQSVKAQVYPHWELVVWDDASPQAATHQLVADEAAADPRIRALGHAVNAGVSAATNAALQACRGEYVVLLDHDDLLEPQALLRVAQCAVRGRPDFAYGDEVIVTADGQDVVDLVLRPAFSLEYFRHHPYIVHPLIFRREFLLQLGGLDESLRISQDVDLVLRAAEQAQRIAHIPEVLYQWRTLAGSAGHARKAEVTAATVDILQRHLARSGEQAVVEPEEGLFNYYRPLYPVPAGTRVAVVIPTKNHHGLVQQCIESLERTTVGLPVDLFIVDHASDDPASQAYFERLKPRHTVLSHEGPFNFSAINNAAVRRLNGPYTHYLFCNNDVEALEPGWLQTMLAWRAGPAWASWAPTCSTATGSASSMPAWVWACLARPSTSASSSPTWRRAAPSATWATAARWWWGARCLPSRPPAC